MDLQTSFKPTPRSTVIQEKLTVVQPVKKFRLLRNPEVHYSVNQDRWPLCCLQAQGRFGLTSQLQQSLGIASLGNDCVKCRRRRGVQNVRFFRAPRFTASEWWKGTQMVNIPRDMDKISHANKKRLCSVTHKTMRDLVSDPAHYSLSLWNIIPKGWTIFQ
jgi:hypothetical protein